MTSQKKRKQRTIKNGIVNVDDIKIDPGDRYQNWIPEVRKKLGEREGILLAKRMEICHQLVRAALHAFCAQHRHIVTRWSNHCMDTIFSAFDALFVGGERVGCIAVDCQRKIESHLHCWKGVQRSKKKTSTFREYFRISKNWWDQRKIEITANNFWIPLINVIIQTNNQAVDEVCVGPYSHLLPVLSDYLRTVVLHAFFVGMLKMANSRARLLIPAGVYSLLCVDSGGGVAFIQELLAENRQRVTGAVTVKGGKNTRQTIIELLKKASERSQAQFVLTAYDHANTTELVQATPAVNVERTSSRMPGALIDVQHLNLPPPPPLSPESSPNHDMVEVDYQASDVDDNKRKDSVVHVHHHHHYYHHRSSSSSCSSPGDANRNDKNELVGHVKYQHTVDTCGAATQPLIAPCADALQLHVPEAPFAPTTGLLNDGMVIGLPGYDSDIDHDHDFEPGYVDLDDPSPFFINHNIDINHNYLYSAFRGPTFHAADARYEPF
eukprot:CAMPEP_0202709128 /NCGR_PEP_ID=MMETSP1385-20130828/21258_1 /ASSEMBLY_ACC=CAM_ASM_000861 /TAXON_ID=933848 /ORGANISM="Elphidium margaritaceum" /LENGTH=493 /DNA_ID=CAMNT_0049368295 /DNA_START=213 /DNA_END=1694 /DNA_ORIENTATION=+